MTAQRTVFFWGFYVIGIGLVLLTIPNVLFTIFGLPTTNEPWARVLGALAAGVGFYYLECGRTGDMTFSRLTVAGRAWFALCLVAIVVVGLARWPLVLFALVDLVGAAWTAYELRRAHEPLLPFGGSA